MIELLPEDWKTALNAEFEQPYFQNLEDSVEKAYRETTVYPPRAFLFEAFRLCPLADLKVVLIGQDPYHGPSQAHGLSFSVNPGCKFPPSLRNIFKELMGIVKKDCMFASNTSSLSITKHIVFVSTFS